MPCALAVLSGVNNRVLNYREFSFGPNCAFRFNFQRVVQRGQASYVAAVMAPSDFLRSYSSKSWLVPRFSLQIYCTAKAVGKALSLAAIVLQMLMTTLQERLMPKLSSSCPSLCRSHRALGLANVQLTPAAGPGAGAELAISHLVA